MRDFLQRLKYTNNQDIQVSTYFYLSLISYQLGNNQLSQSYIQEFLRLMPDDILGFIIQDKYMIGYSYDIPNSDISQYTTGSHEFMFGSTFRPSTENQIMR